MRMAMLWGADTTLENALHDAVNIPYKVDPA